MRETAKKNVFIYLLYSRGCTGRSLCFHVEKCQHADQKQAYATIDLDIESTLGQPAWCRARPMNEDDGIKHIRWIRGIGGERLPAASYAFLPNLKGLPGIFWHRRGIEIFCRLFCTHQRPNVFCIRRLAGVHHVSPAVL